MSAVAPPQATTSATKAGTKIRLDIQGLRAIAVALVVVYHLWPERLTGGFVGVDVFFVISGFLITSHLIKRPPANWHGLTAFWGRRIRRLLPVAFVVLAATALGSRLLAPPTQWGTIAKEIISSALYMQNWVLAGSSVDYLAAENAPTPTQHFWSLSLEEQFYLFWPLLVFAVFWIAGKRGLNARRLLFGAVAAVVVLSLMFSITATAAEPGSAYFITPTRMWELGLGGLVALAAPALAQRLPQAARAALAWVGVAAIVSAGALYTGSTPFPGYTALLPVVGTALVIFASAEGRLSPTALMRNRPVQWLGAVSYSVYLWHWPLIVLLPYVTGGELGWLDKSLILTATLVLAGLSKTFVEDRFRFPSSQQGLAPTFRFAAVGMVLLTAVGGVQLMEVNQRTSQGQQQLAAMVSNGDPCFGAASLAKGFDECDPDPQGPVVPEPALAKDDKSDAYADGCWSNQPFTDRPVCMYGDGPTKVALVGNSHAGHWLPALQVLAEQNDWTISTYLVSMCNPTSVPLQFDTEEKTANCTAYGEWVMDETSGDAFDLVITSERQSVPVQGESWDSTEDAAIDGYREYLSRWSDSDANVLVIKDPPYPGNTIDSIPDCLAENPGNPQECSGTPDEWDWMDPLTAAALEMDTARIQTVDMDQYFCAGGSCPAVVGSVVTYFDASHITATYSETLAPFLEQPILTALHN
ncbi:acyltransferase family protein [Arthrobacter sp. NPDC089319]|uniref:acyltransferase family protein n=1 Tax=Arthrobacter sp. NPDC089319 TaxID=3155915 RepID=UPI00341B7990